MIKIFFSVFLVALTYHLSFGQNDTQLSIFTADGILTVSKTAGGKDMILFNVKLWDDIMKGTKYTSTNPAISKPVHVCFEITDKKQMHCNGGIGFRCGIYDCNCYSNTKPVVINNKNRVCSAIIQKIGRQTIRVVFCDEIDWESLQCEN